MKNICLYFRVHQPSFLKSFRFFNIGSDETYFDDIAISTNMQKLANKCYLPANKILTDQIKKTDGKFKVAFSISGVTIDQFEKYTPSVLESFKELAETGCVEFLAQSFSNSLASLGARSEFEFQIARQLKKYDQHFNKKPKAFVNTELIYSNEIGKAVSDLGFNTILTEGADHILGYRSPNYLYTNPSAPKQKVLMRNYKLSDDIAYRFSKKDWHSWPLTAEKYCSWITALPKDENFVNIFMDYETFGEHHWIESGIFDFLAALGETALNTGKLGFATPSEIAKNNKAADSVNIPHPISWSDEERDLTAWLGNELQRDTFNLLYKLAPTVAKINEHEITNEYLHLQSADHFYYMSTKMFSQGAYRAQTTPYDSPYTAYINYMNVLNDFIIKIGYKENKNALINELNDTIEERNRLITVLEKDIDFLQRKLSKKRIKR